MKHCCSPSRRIGIDAGDRSGVMRSATAPAAARTWVRIEQCRFTMGCDRGEGFADDGEGPAREVRIDSFFISPTVVSNDEFARFVDDTGYETDSERHGWSFVFRPQAAAGSNRRGAVADMPWWHSVEGASWRHPDGPGSDLDGAGDHPVTQVSWFDAMAYCQWSGARLPTEAEWECAARAGLEGKRYPWGDSLMPGGEHHCNIWQGRFPTHNAGNDGYAATAPVDAFPPNGWGLHNVSGNVWEWCDDWFTPRYHRVTGLMNPRHVTETGSRSMRGGSYLCHHSYCNRYRVAARSSNTPDSSTGHCGFRIAADVPP